MQIHICDHGDIMPSYDSKKLRGCIRPETFLLALGYRKEQFPKRGVSAFSGVFHVLHSTFCFVKQTS